MKKNWIAIVFLIVSIIALFSIIYYRYQGEIGLTMTIFGAILSALSLIISVIALLPKEKNPPKENPPVDKSPIVIVNIFVNAYQIILNMSNNSDVSIINVRVKMGEQNICVLENTGSFPIDKVIAKGSFVVMLKRNSFSATDISKFTIDYEDWQGTHSLGKAVDVVKGVEVKA